MTGAPAPHLPRKVPPRVAEARNPAPYAYYTDPVCVDSTCSTRNTRNAPHAT